MRNPLVGCRILVIEDEMIVAQLLRDMLDDLGCLVVGVAVSVGEALSKIEVQDFDAALLDVNLSGQMSYPVADALVACHAPFVFSSGYPSNRLQEGYRTFPALQKPYHVSDLRDALVGVLAAAAPSAELCSGLAATDFAA